MAKERIEYVDCIKGFSILWVVIIHLGNNLPDWIMAPYRMPLFFFMSGIFFSFKPFKKFFVRKINTLIIPLLFFLFIPFCIFLVKEEIISRIIHLPPPNQSVYEQVASIKALFNVYNEYINLPLQLNTVLWFLFALFNIQLLFYGLKKIITDTWILAIISILLTTIGEICTENNINGLFFIPLSLRYFMWYTFGSLFGRNLINKLSEISIEIYIVIISLIILIVLPFIKSEYLILNKLNIYIRTLFFIPIAFVFFKNFYHLKIFKPLIFFGKNSLIVLGTHRTIFWFFTFVILRAKPDWQYNGMIEDYSFYAAMFLFTCFIEYFVIIFLNKYFPWFVAKRDLIKLKQI